MAAADRGNYPVVGFSTPAGDVVDHYPTVSAERGGQLVHGHVAVAAARDGAPYLRSWKRLIGRFGPQHRVRIGTRELTLLELATDFLRALGTDLRERSNLTGPLDELPEVVISVPANAHSSQRFTTLEAFVSAGFPVRAMINEPSAAAIEFSHRYRGSLNARRDHVCVYDLGGGTFDAALVMVAGDRHEVIDTSGVQELGGDDFDAILMELALEALGMHPFELPDDLRALLDECRAAKESIGPNTRRVALDLSSLGELAPEEAVVLDVAVYYDRLRPLVDQSIASLTEVMTATASNDRVADLKRVAEDAGVAGVYVVGGGSGLPLVARQLREHFGRRVHRSLVPAASTAIGLAIAADAEREPPLAERFTRHFGVFREKNEGEGVAFDSIFPRGTLMPRPGEEPLRAVRRYRARHNVGCFRFIECAAVDARHEPGGDISPHATIRFPFEPALRDGGAAGAAVERIEGLGRAVEECFEVDAAGVVTVMIRDLEDGYAERHVL